MTNKEKLDTISIEEMEIECQKQKMCEGCKYHSMWEDFCIMRVKKWLESEVTENDEL